MYGRCGAGCSRQLHSRHCGLVSSWKNVKLLDYLTVNASLILSPLLLLKPRTLKVEQILTRDYKLLSLIRYKQRERDTNVMFKTLVLSTAGFQIHSRTLDHCGERAWEWMSSESPELVDLRAETLCWVDVREL